MDVKVEPVNHICRNHFDHHGMLITTAPQVDGLFMLDRVLDLAPESTKHTHIDDSCLLGLKTTGYAPRHDAENRMLCHHRLAHVGLTPFEIMPMITDAPKMTGQWERKSYIE
jgi:hypothetical protein